MRLALTLTPDKDYHLLSIQHFYILGAIDFSFDFQCPF